MEPSSTGGRSRGAEVELNTNSSKMDAEDTPQQEVLKELQTVPECWKYAEKWMKNDLDPTELLDFVKLLRKAAPADSKPSGASWFSGRPSSGPSWPSWLAGKQSSGPAAVTVGFVVTGETFGAHRTVLDQVKEKHLKLIPLDGRKQQQCQRLIVFCPITSRAGSDVEAAMMAPAVSASSQPLILVLMHHTRDVEYSTAGRSCLEKFPRVASEVHFLFHETQPGLLKCPENSRAAQELKLALG